MRVNFKQFSEALRLTKKFMGKPSSKLAVFGCAELRVGAESLTLRKWDGDAEIAINLPCERGPFIRQEVLTVPIEAALKALKAVKADPLGGLELDSVPDRPSAFRIGPLTLNVGVPPADLPAMLDAHAKLRPVDDGFLDALRCVLPTISQDPTRIALCGAWIDGPMVSTDGHRMHLCKTIDGTTLIDHDGCAPQGEHSDVLPFVPLRIVETILAMKKPTAPHVGFRHFTVPSEQEGVAAAHTLDGEWRCQTNGLDVSVHWRELAAAQPDWREIEPGKPNVQITLPASTLRAELALAAAHLPDNNVNAITMFRCAASSLVLRTRNDDDGRDLDRPLTPTAYQLDGAAGVAAFNLRYLEEAIDACTANGDGEVTLAFYVEDPPGGDRTPPEERDAEYPRGCYGPPLRLTSAAHPERSALVMPCRT